MGNRLKGMRRGFHHQILIGKSLAIDLAQA
jgi:hypothetical protein